jgi:polyisoprenyl-teichoic acid--peptidoglycan teichoic acid transferase
MDNSRFKTQRSTQTRRQTIDGFDRARFQPTQPAALVSNSARKPVLRPAPVVQPHPVILSQRRLSGADMRRVQPASANAAEQSPATQPARRLPRVDMGLPGDTSPDQKSGPIVRGRKRASMRRWAFRGVATLLILLTGLGGLLFSQGFLKLHKVFKGGTVSAAALKTNVDPTLLKGEGDGRINVLLLGRGGGTHDAPDLTDTMMLASIDPINHTSTLLSIPRDFWVDVPNDGAMKINAAWETGKYKYLGKVSGDNSNTQSVQAGFDLVDQTVESVIGVPIHYNMLLDFQAFRQAVDTLGGVDVNVPTDLVDPTMAWENAGNSVLAKAGAQTFDGKHALIYVRSRETSTDFARSVRQRSVLLALKEKVKTLGTLSNPLKLSGLMNSFGNNVQTDLSLGDGSRLYNIFKDVSNANTTSIGLGDATTNLITTGMINGQSTVQPKAGLFKYSDIQNFVRGQLKDPYLTKENAKIMILNGTSQPGLATTESNLLKSYGYNIVGAANAPTSGYARTTVIDLNHGKDKYTKHYLEQRLNVTATTTLPDATIQQNQADFVIIVGSDETTTSQG